MAGSVEPGERGGAGAPRPEKKKDEHFYYYENLPPEMQRRIFSMAPDSGVALTSKSVRATLDPLSDPLKLWQDYKKAHSPLLDLYLAEAEKLYPETATLKGKELALRRIKYLKTQLYQELRSLHRQFDTLSTLEVREVAPYRPPIRPDELSTGHLTPKNLVALAETLARSENDIAFSTLRLVIAEVLENQNQNLTGIPVDRLILLLHQTPDEARAYFQTATDLSWTTAITTLSLASPADFEEIHSIPPEINHFTSLTNLDLSTSPSFTGIRRIGSRALAGLSHLHTLDLRGNKITAIAPDAFVGLTALTDLYLDPSQVALIEDKIPAGVTLHIQMGTAVLPGGGRIPTYRERPSIGAPSEISRSGVVLGEGNPFADPERLLAAYEREPSLTKYVAEAKFAHPETEELRGEELAIIRVKHIWDKILYIRETESNHRGGAPFPLPAPEERFAQRFLPAGLARLADEITATKAAHALLKIGQIPEVRPLWRAFWDTHYRPGAQPNLLEITPRWRDHLAAADLSTFTHLHVPAELVEVVEAHFPAGITLHICEGSAQIEERLSRGPTK